MNDQGCGRLRDMLIIQAALDYLEARVLLATHPRSRKAGRTIEEMEAFFRSEWYDCLTEGGSCDLVRELREMPDPEKAIEIIREEFVQ